MQQLNIDVAVIGAGTAGLAAYRAAKAGGKTAVLIEAGPHGTTCARVGCMPSKLLISAADAAHEARHADGFGVHVAEVRVDGVAVMDRVRRERDRFVGFVVESVESFPAEDRIEGRAQFVAPNELQIDDHTRIHAERIVIATGSTPRVDAELYALGDRLVVNDHVFDWHDLPKRVAILGPGVIGLELGQALARLGVNVHIFGRSGSLAVFSDPAVRDYAIRTFQQEFTLDVSADIQSITRIGDEVEIRYTTPDHAELRCERFDYLLAAAGRVPNVQSLNLEKSGLSLTPHGMPVYDPQTLQCGNASVFIAGDVNGIFPLLHEAADEGTLAGRNAALWPNLSPIKRRAPIGIVFSDPQIAIVGQRWSQLTPDTFVTGVVSFENQGRSRVMLKNRGLMHLYADRNTGRFLGAEWLGPRAENIAHTLAWAYQMNLTISDMLAMPFYHPVIEEGLRTALRDAQAQLDAKS